jgi:photosystem II stability/assembly factor-like uncharacterized protein
LIAIAGVAGANPALVPGTWVNITPPGLSSGDFAQGVTVDPSNPSTLYYCEVNFSPVASTGLYKTTNAGSTWARIGNMDEPIHVRVDPHNSNHLYCVDGVRGATMGFWKSTDGGATWTQPQGFKDKCADPTVATSDGYSIAVDPSDFNHVLFSFHSPWPDRAGYTYSCGALESTDGGETWVIRYPGAGMIGPGFAIFFLYSPDLKVGNKNTWLMGCQGSGFFRTSDAGATWTPVNTNQMSHGGDQLYYTRSGVLFAGTSAWPSGPMHSTDNGITWQACNLKAMYTIGVMGDGTTLYTGGFNGTSPIYVSPESDGVNWTQYNNQTFGSGPFELDFDKTNSIMYMATPADGIWALKTKTTTAVSSASMATRHKSSSAAVKISVGGSGLALADQSQKLFDFRGRSISRAMTTTGLAVMSPLSDR